eukprot:COSAG02_NODE_8268_length_2636_cov_13.262121_2_plen_821_part_01
MNWVEGDLPRLGTVPGPASDLVVQPTPFASSPEECARRCLDIPACTFFELETVEPRCSLGFSALQFEQPPKPISGCTDVRSTLYDSSATVDNNTCKIDSCEWGHTIGRGCSANSTCQSTGWSNQMLSSCPGGRSCSDDAQTVSLWSDFECTCHDGFLDTHGNGTLCEVPVVVCTTNPACPDHYHPKPGSAEVECIASPSFSGSCDFTNDADYPDVDESYEADLAACCEVNQCIALNSAGRAELGYVATGNDFQTTTFGIGIVACADDFYQSDSDVAPSVACFDDDGLGDDAFIFSGCSAKGTCAASASAVTCGVGYVAKEDYDRLDGTDEAACCDVVSTCTDDPACPTGYKIQPGSVNSLCSGSICDFVDDTMTLGTVDDSYIADLAACCTENECSPVNSTARAMLGYVATGAGSVTTASALGTVTCSDDFYQSDSDVAPSVACFDDDGLGDDAFIFSGCSAKGTCAASASAVTCGVGYVAKEDYDRLDGTDEAACCDDDDPCLSEPCLHEGICLKLNETDSSGGWALSFSCTCPDEWAGDTCDVFADGCVSAPCQNGGICISRFFDATLPAGGYRCVCDSAGYFDNTVDYDCGEYRDECYQPDNENWQPTCQNGGICISSNSPPIPYTPADVIGDPDIERGSHTCICSKDFSGESCEFFEVIYGCTDTRARNFDPMANTNDYTCMIDSCLWDDARGCHANATCTMSEWDENSIWQDFACKCNAGFVDVSALQDGSLCVPEFKEYYNRLSFSSTSKTVDTSFVDACDRFSLSGLNQPIDSMNGLFVVSQMDPFIDEHLHYHNVDDVRKLNTSFAAASEGNN